MKTTLYYFTGTGNSWAVAKDLQNKLPDSELIPVVKNGTVAQISPDTKIIGLFFPVYIWAIPLIVEEFIEKNDFPKDAYVFAVTTCGGSAGYALKYLNNLLKAKQKSLSAGFVIKMPGNYTPMYGAHAIEKQQKFFDQAKNRIPEIAKVVQSQKIVPVESSLGILGWFIAQVMYAKFIRAKVNSMDKSFHADNNCISCGKCAAVCPVNNIVMENKKPVWNHKCQQCYACLHVCPVQALQAGKKTAGRKRYKHPDYNFKGHNF